MGDKGFFKPQGGVLGARRMLLLATVVAGLGTAVVLAPNYGTGIAF